MYKLTVEGLHKSYGDNEVLKVSRSRPRPAT
jgi:ABC-type histidine transport system ATPase subunit